MSRQVQRTDSNVDAEEQPLYLSDNGEFVYQSKATITHHDSVYSLMVFVFPLARLERGHYWTLPVLISCMLFIIAVMCQVGLTLIAGEHIRAMSSAFKTSLVRTDGNDIPGAITPMDFALASASHAVFGRKVGIDDLDITKYLPTGADAKEEVCCNGAECAALRLTCCDRSDVAITARTNETAARSKASMLMAMPKSAVEETKPKHVGRSWDEMCYRHQDGMLDCTPPSFLYIDVWDELDSNGDGVWSIEEARADQANLGCRFGVSADEMFRSACHGIEKDAQDTGDNSYTMPLVPVEIEKQHGISREYFDWWKALVVICVAPDLNRCSGLVQSGVFDGAIRMAREAEITRGGVGDLDTALDFCQRMLTRNGICEKTLPVSYQMYRSRLGEKCGAPSYTPAGRYRNPHDKRDAMNVVAVNYSMYDSYLESSSIEFQVFMFLILTVWYVSLLSELKAIVALIDFTWNFTVNKHSPILTPNMEAWVREHMTGKLEFMGLWLLPTPSTHRKDGEHISERSCHPSELKWVPTQGTFARDQRHIMSDLDNIMVMKSHSHFHSTLCYLMCGIRLLLWLYLQNVGTSLVLYERDYSELLMNAVALAFIFKLPEFLYHLLVPEPTKRKLQGATCEAFSTSLPRRGCGKWLSSPMAWGLTIVPLIVATIVYYNLAFNTRPFLEALQCACYQHGPSCNVAPRFQKAWWDTYWQGSVGLAKRRSSWLQPA